MTDLQKEIDQAFKLVSTLPVNGDAVDVISAAREHLRRAFGLAAPSTEEAGDQDG